MTPAAAAECVNAFKPKVVYLYHYDQSWASNGTPLKDRAATVDAFKAAVDAAVEVRDGGGYPR
jgi:L-ascorbate metabolism protein UlaG (beta-lactamase superfamily)